MFNMENTVNTNERSMHEAYMAKNMITIYMSYSHTVVVLRMMSTSSLSSGTTSSTKRGIVGTTGGGVINAAFLALKRNL